jgi:hypothetical protein
LGNFLGGIFSREGGFSPGESISFEVLTPPTTVSTVLAEQPVASISRRRGNEKYQQQLNSEIVASQVV